MSEQEQRENAIELVRAANTADAATPETDARAAQNDGLLCGAANLDLARRLERERDWARVALRLCQNAYFDVSHDMAVRHEAETEAVKAERDKYRAALEGIAPFVMDGYRPDFATPEYRAAVEAMKEALHVSVTGTDGHCALCGQPATHVCHCPQCQDSLADDGDNPDEGRPLCKQCGDDAVVSNAGGEGRAVARTSPPPCSASDLSAKYHELLYAVERCFPGESRHETALRYIRETERRVSEVGSCKQNAVNDASAVSR